MLDIRFIVEHVEEVKKSVQARGLHVDVDAVVSLYHQKKTAQQTLEKKRADANQVAKTIPTIQDAAEKKTWIEKGRALNTEISTLEAEAERLSALYDEALLTIPNTLPTDTPTGASDAENIEIRKYGEPTVFDFIPEDHVQIGQRLDLLDFESGTKVTGPKFYFIKREAVLLEIALKMFAMKIAREAGYTPVITPDLAKNAILTGIGFAPRGDESNVYNVEGTDLSLIATAEITVGGMHADEIIAHQDLPLKYVAESHCFRREAGAGGRESKGLYRVHQFSKIELFQITKPEDADAALEEIVGVEEKIYQALKLPYRVMRICAGDLGAPAYKKYDIEVFMPGRESEEKYGEVTSASHCGDFQSRRLRIRYKDADNHNSYPYTLNGTAIALSRTLMAILENYQQKDGSIMVPEVLRAFVGFDKITRS